VALAQGDNAFVDTHNVSLGDVVQMIRGAPGTLVQLQVLPVDAAADSPPRTVTIWRDQLKFRK
jgi:C-terminal processing protease CtpA/Prc